MILLAFILGAIVGSFLNVAILRLPRGKSLSGRSGCPHCHRQLQSRDLIPLISYIFLMGRCRGCKAPISIRYPLIELLTGIGFLLVAYCVPGADTASILQFLLYALIVSVGVVTFVVDFEQYLILNSVTGAGVLILLVLVVALDFVAGQNPVIWPSRTLDSLLGAALGPLLFLFLWLVSKGRWMGLGDVKFMVFMGAALGFPLVFIGMLFAFWLGALMAIPLLAMGYKQLGSKVPFGCFLVCGLILALCFGQPLLSWYVGLFP